MASSSAEPRGESHPAAPLPQLVPPPAIQVPPQEDSPNLFFAVAAPVALRVAREPPWRALLNWVFFLTLVGAGVALTIVTLGASTTLLLALGNILIDGGFTPLVLALWRLLVGYGLRRRDDVVRVASAAVLIIVGYFVAALSPDIGSVQWISDRLGPALFAIGALFFISRLFFIAEDDEKRIQALEEELQRARQSPAFGLALSYFYNFVLPVSRNLRAAPAPPADTVVSSEVNVLVERGSDKTRCVLHERTFFVLVPRDLTGVDIKAQLTKAIAQGEIVNGKVEAPQRGDGHRPMFAYLFTSDTAAGTCSGLFDVPTIVSSIWDRASRGPPDDSTDGDGPHRAQLPLPRRLVRTVSNAWSPPPPPPPRLDVRTELLLFQNFLVKLVQEHPDTRDCVAILSIPSLPLDFAAMRTVAAQYRAPSSRKRELQAAAANAYSETQSAAELSVASATSGTALL